MQLSVDGEQKKKDLVIREHMVKLGFVHNFYIWWQLDVLIHRECLKCYIEKCRYVGMFFSKILVKNPSFQRFHPFPKHWLCFSSCSLQLWKTLGSLNNIPAEGRNSNAFSFHSVSSKLLNEFSVSVKASPPDSDSPESWLFPAELHSTDCLPGSQIKESISAGFPSCSQGISCQKLLQKAPSSL